MSVKFKNPNIAVTGVFCDWLSFTVSIEDKGTQKAIRNRIASISQTGHSAKAARRWPYKLGSKVCLDDLTGEWMNFHCDPWSPGTAFLRVEFNPAKINLEYAKAFAAYMAGLSWPELVAGCTVTRFDATVDVHGVHVDGLLVIYPKLQISHIHCKGGKTTGYELGGYDGNKTITIYDKPEQIKHLNKKKPKHQQQPIPDGSITRIEISLAPDLSFEQLGEMENVFAKLVVQDYALLPKVDDELFRVFTRLAQARGAQDALLVLDPARRLAFKKKMENAVCPWWNPTEIWACWPHCLAELTTPQQTSYVIGVGP